MSSTNNNFDFALLDVGGPSRYDLNNVLGAVAFQKMVRGFWSVVKTSPETLADKQAEVARFIELVSAREAWPLASNMVPEFRLPQTHDTSGPGILNEVLGAVAPLRPQVSYYADQLASLNEHWLDDDNLRALRTLFDAFPSDLKPAKEAYNLAAEDGISTFALFTIRDKLWNQLSDDQKELLVDMRELELKAAKRAA